jgi:hypothetical protein
MLRLFWGERTGRGSERVRRAERRGGAVRRDHRPALEGLEERIVLVTDTWMGTVSANWSVAANWASGTAPLPGDDLIFSASATRLSTVNDFPAGTAFNSITIQASNYNLSGAALNLTAGIAASYTSGTSNYFIDTTLAAVQAQIVIATGGTLVIGNSTTGTLSGSSSVNVTGGGTLDLVNTNTYTGPTTIGSGTRVLVDGQITSVLNTGGLLAGNGTVSAVQSVGGTIFAGHPSPGTNLPPTPGQLTSTGSVALDNGSTFGALLNGTAPGNGVVGYSQLIVTSGLVSLGGATLSLLPGNSYSPALGDKLTIIKNNTGAPVNGVFAGLPEGGAVTSGNSLFRISYLGGGGNDVVLTAVSTTSTTTLLPVGTSSNPASPITLSAQVSGSQGIPTGTVEFFNGNPSAGGRVIGTASVNPSTGLATTSVTSFGNTGTAPVLYAVYIPTPTSLTYAGSTSAPISFATTTTLTSSSPVALIGQPVTFTATVAPSSPGAGTPSGSVAFSVDGTVVATVPLNTATGQASFTTSSLSIGTHQVVAQFNANAPFQSSISATFTQAVSTAGTVPTLTLVPVRNRHGKVVSFELVVQLQSTVASASAAPTGSVTYFINGRAFYRTVPVSGGVAVLTRPWQRLTNHTIYVRYNGDATFVASASPNFLLSHQLLNRASQGPVVVSRPVRAPIES